MRHGSLAAALIRRVAVLVAVMAIVLDVAAVVVARQLWMANLDGDLRMALRSPMGGNGPAGQMSPFASELELLVVDGKAVVSGVSQRGHGREQLGQEQIDILMGVRPDGRPHTVFVPDLGPYRVASQIAPNGQHVVGISLFAVTAAVSRLVMLELFLTVGAVVAAALVAAAVVRRTLRPLTSLAGTASRVASMRLDQGEVQLERLSGPAVDPVSEVGRVGLAFNHMLDNVEDALVARHRSEARVRSFVADASHELRNPLASIRGYSELLARDKAMPEQQSLAVDRIGVESRRMSRLVDEMLLLARLDQGAPAETQPVDMSELLVGAVADASVAGPDHQWKLDVPDEPLIVRGDENQLHEVVSNLLGNARKHTPPGTHVLVRLQRLVPAQPPTPGVQVPPPAQVVLTVADDGPGVAPEILPSVFERFVRADQARTHDDEGSTGLGLSIVAAVVASLGGYVGVESVPGATRFTVVLPAA